LLFLLFFVFFFFFFVLVFFFFVLQWQRLHDNSDGFTITTAAP